jgi:hypothetical protein
MTVDSRKVTGRRSLKYEAFEDFLADAELLAAADVRMLGNWSLGQIFRHLAIAINGSVDGFAFRLPWIATFFARLFLKKRMLTRGIAPGYGRSPKWDSVKPAAASVEEGLTELRAALTRFRTETKRSPHPALGKLTSDEWQQFHLRHAELHMSFAIPQK